jgi:hypothetical protein
MTKATPPLYRPGPPHSVKQNRRRLANWFSTAHPPLPEKNRYRGRLSTCSDRNLGRTIGIRGLWEDVVGRLLVIDVVGAVVALGAWYFLFAAYNRRKGTEALRWVQSACAGKDASSTRTGSIVRLHARLRFLPAALKMPTSP